MTTDLWFDHELPPGGKQRTYVQRLQSLAVNWNFDELSPALNSRNWSWDPGRRLVEVDTPGLTCGLDTLRVLYTPDSREHPLLESEWGDQYIFDGAGDSGGLYVDGVVASPEQCAEWTATWLQSQLRRPVVRREWDRPATGAARLLPAHSDTLAVVEWWFTDTNEMVTSTSRLIWGRLAKSPPSRQIQERPDRTVLH